MNKRVYFSTMEAELPALNARLEKAGHGLRLVAGARYGYSAIDLAKPEQVASFCCQSTLCTGTPRECLSAAQAYVLQHI